MAEAVVGFVAEAFGNLSIEEAKFLPGVSDQVEQLQLEVDRLRSFLQDAEARQNEQRDIQVWISQSRDFAYEAEDLLEEYAFRIAFQRENTLKRAACFLKECYFRRSIGSEIQKLTSKISGLTRSFQEYGIRSVRMEREGSSSASQLQLRRTYSHAMEEDDFINLDNDVEMIVGHLVNENESDLHGVVSISGMGGIGKTTLARKVYNNPQVQGCFDDLAWVCISQQWQKRDILQGILIKFFPWLRKEILKWRDEELIRKNFQTLRDKKCLVVLDDIWSIDAWESIKEAFSVTKKGSKLLLTTRNRGVALHIEPNGFHHEPRLLRDLESWELLQMKALRERTHNGHEEMQEMKELGKEMVKHCGGLPLALVVLGGILATKRDIKEWKTVHKNVKAHVGNGRNIVQQQGELEKILALSYDDLPQKLKPCFLYLGRFPEDSDIDVEILYQLWIAEGMISMKDQKSEESVLDVAESYLGELAERSLVQVKVDDDMLRVTSIQYCRLHDLLRHLSLEKAKEENFFSFVHSRNGFDDQIYKSSSSTHQIHRLVIHFQDEDVLKYVPPHKRITKHLRSLRISVEGSGYEGPMPRKLISQFRWFRMLRVLEIEGLSHPDGNDCKEFCCVNVEHLKLPEAFSSLIHLRYLLLRGSVLVWLPLSLGNLKHLQTINLRDAMNLWIPNVLWKMKQLKYLYLPEYAWGTFVCHKLRFHGLNRLEILEGFDSSTCSYKDLLKLPNLRWLQAKLDVKYNDIVEMIKFIYNSKRLCKVELHITFPTDDSLTTEKFSEVITRLFSCRKLISLDMGNPIGNLPKYEASFALDLVSLTLRSSKIEDDPMDVLERMPNLKYLCLDIESFLGAEIRCHAAGFPQLREIQFWVLPNLEKWIISDGAMPNLSSIWIMECRKLEMIPEGLRFIKTLKELLVDRMPQEFNSRLEVIDGQEGEDFYKIQHVPSVKVSEGWISWRTLQKTSRFQQCPS